MIKIVDYGLGNIQAFLTMYKGLGIEIERASVANELEDADCLILPGVGSFDHAMTLLNNSGLRERLEELVLIKKIPIIGICVGMQILADSSDEGDLPGLGWIPGRVVSFESNHENENLPLPHMGWNDIEIIRQSPLFSDLSEENKFYFLHSYYYLPESKDYIIAQASYGVEFASVISKDNVFGIQCHPEKSHHFGANLLRRFSEL